jgi:hypothetical protein
MTLFAATLAADITSKVRRRDLPLTKEEKAILRKAYAESQKVDSSDFSVAETTVILSGQGKSGHAWSLQNRPYGMAQDVTLFIPLSPDRASLF